ncbi:helix-turn-helix domain-containing protein [Bermanella marisrubri]|uniref:HTH-type transcriptional regulator eutR n=2 Tax=Bermanella marisrubri TaxID=207949 RepID=Q1N3C0_9GAMM|nr:HTH-type transcriptional regulator eutR [Oceanobacter sp. RED65] [Bermanella marisrubri]QIZ85867.1 helix-turn-helix domain-containing protein [Bermanella marisrubri]
MNQNQLTHAHSRCGKIRHITAHDADEHAHNLTNWQQEYDQVSPGAFEGSIKELQLNGIQVFKEFTSQSVFQKCNVWSDSLWIGLPESKPEQSRINGHHLQSHQVMCRPGDIDFSLMTPSQFNIFGIVIDQSLLSNIEDSDYSSAQQFSLSECISLKAKTYNNLHYLLQRLLMHPHDGIPEKVCHDLLLLALHDVLTPESVNCLPPTSLKRRNQIVDLTLHYLKQHHDEPVTVTELCTLACVSRRTLQYSFESVLGISPAHFLRISRLNGARRSLRQATEQDCIADVAAQWGFWHLSQFAKDYKQLFGELPSETKHLYSTVN